MTDSYITVGDGSTTFVGPDATPTRTFHLASQITGKVYKRGQYDQAIADVNEWIWAMEAALPVVKR